MYLCFLCIDIVLVLESLFFFFYRYGHHRDLHVLTHSFPTRRSSDLLTDTARSMNRDPSRISSQKVERMLEGRGIMKSSITPTRPRISHRSNRPTPSKRAFFEIRRANHLMRFASETDIRILAAPCAVALMFLPIP